MPLQILYIDLLQLEKMSYKNAEIFDCLNNFTLDFKIFLTLRIWIRNLVKLIFKFFNLLFCSRVNLKFAVFKYLFGFGIL